VHGFQPNAPEFSPNSYPKTVIFVHFRGDQKVTKAATLSTELLWTLRNSFSESDEREEFENELGEE
jgi:hypothetical protein